MRCFLILVFNFNFVLIFSLLLIIVFFSIFLVGFLPISTVLEKRRHRTIRRMVRWQWFDGSNGSMPRGSKLPFNLKVTQAYASRQVDLLA